MANIVGTAGNDDIRPGFISPGVTGGIVSALGDSILGLDGDDALNGAAGVDTIRGGAGRDSINGGGGADLLFGDAGDDFLAGEPGASLTGGAGADSFAIASFQAGGMPYSTLATMLTVTDFRPAEGDTLSINAGEAVGPLNSGFAFLIYATTLGGVVNTGGVGTGGVGTGGVGTSGPPQLGTELPNFSDGRDVAQLYWFADSATSGGWLVVDANQDQLIDATDFVARITMPDEPPVFAASWFGAGELALVGSEADDTLTLDGATYLLSGQGGNDTLVGNDLASQFFGGAGDDSMRGAGGADFLIGGDGTDSFAGGAGDDLLYGEAGNDLAHGDDGNDEIAGDQGNDTLYGDAGDDYLYGGVDGFLGVADADVVFGGAGDDTLEGGAGADALDGGTGDDSLDGGIGADALIGGAGDDSFLVDAQGDLVFENPGDGFDTVITSASFYLYANIESLVLVSGAVFGVGNALDNLITGNAAANTIIALDGADTVQGGGGNDILYGLAGDDRIEGEAGVDFLAGGEGDDTLLGGLNGDNLYGEAGDDSLSGGSDFVFDQLVGGAGADTLDGASGNGDFDYLYGGEGDDLFQVDTPADLVFEFAAGGDDTVIASINGAGYYLYDGIETLILAGSTPFGVGNALANTLLGNAGGNFLLGGAGDDSLDGGAGNDVLFGEAGADVFSFRRGTGGDVIGDFTAGADRIRLEGLGFANVAQVQAAVSVVGGDSAINLGQGDFIVIHGVTSFSAADFLLA